MTNISSAGCFSSQIMAQNAAMNFWQAYILLILFRLDGFFDLKNWGAGQTYPGWARSDSKLWGHQTHAPQFG